MARRFVLVGGVIGAWEGGTVWEVLPHKVPPKLGPARGIRIDPNELTASFSSTGGDVAPSTVYRILLSANRADPVGGRLEAVVASILAVATKLHFMRRIALGSPQLLQCRRIKLKKVCCFWCGGFGRSDEALPAAASFGVAGLGPSGLVAVSFRTGGGGRLGAGGGFALNGGAFLEKNPG